ncbi:aldo/keto reductase [Phenylobacterium zucineum]|uniref:aldo/keto reductase n=1 Tax=Phenylobacterium zucineum TaxID=284016 RepID=UPI00191C29C6|nr:aldo/keto reductase [Phenylobacterium zucineum]
MSRLAFGAMTFGGPSRYGLGKVDAQGAQAMVGAALDAGINLFDTADVYNEGQSETLLGEALRGCREEALIATKVGAKVGDGLLDCRLSAHHIHRSIDGSLRRLGTDWVDVYICHRPDFLTPLEETLAALDQVIRAGKARYIGFSNWPAWLAARAIEIQKREGWSRFVVAQMYYSLVGRDVEAEVVPCALASDVGLMVWSPLAAGFLSGKYTDADPSGGGGRLATRTSFSVGATAEARARWSPILEAQHRIARARGVPPATVALAWVGQRPAVSTVLLGATRPEQLADNLRAADFTLSEAEMAELEHLSRPESRYPQTFLPRVYEDPAYHVVGRVPEPYARD